MSSQMRCRLVSRIFWVLGAVGLSALVFAGPVAAQGVSLDTGAAPDSLGHLDEAASDKWRYTVGLGAVAVPDYEGSDNYEAAPLPVLRVQKGHQYGQLFGLKLTSNLVPHPNFRAGPIVNVRPERDDVGNNQVDAMKKVDTAVELGAQIGYDHNLEGGVIGVEVEWVHDVADAYDGWLLTPEIHYRRPLGANWKLNVAVSTTWASDDYMDTYFGVSAADAARSGFPTYSASDGFKDVSLNLGLGYAITDNWNLGIVGGWKRLLNDAEDSPVTKVGSEDQFIGGVYASYSWQGG